MTEALVPLVFGWPAVFTGLFLTFQGVRTGSLKLTLIGALCALPFVFYLSLTPRFWFAPGVWVLFLTVAVLFQKPRQR